MVAEMITKIGIPSDAELFLRVIVASVLGYMIGYERKNRDKSAGMRTHAIVALGAALMMVVSKYGFYDVEKVDSSRVAAQIVSGVGFLGAGVIFVRNNTVSGLTTAAGLWTTAGVGSGSRKVWYWCLRRYTGSSDPGDPSQNLFPYGRTHTGFS